jgi:hypothetical protein
VLKEISRGKNYKEMSLDEEARRKLEKPQCTAVQVIAFVRNHFNLEGGDVDESSAKVGGVYNLNAVVTHSAWCQPLDNQM